MITPPLMSSSPAAQSDIMDTSPLPHKPAFIPPRTVQFSLQTPNPTPLREDTACNVKDDQEMALQPLPTTVFPEYVHG